MIDRQSGRHATRIRLAYRCFPFLLPSLLGAYILFSLPFSFPVQQSLGMVVGIPLALLLQGVVIMAIVLSVLEWREWSLPLSHVS